MSTGCHRGERLGACTDCRRFWAQYRAGAIDDREIAGIENSLATTQGTCAVMGTASTMAICEVLRHRLRDDHSACLAAGGVGRAAGAGAPGRAPALLGE